MKAKHYAIRYRTKEPDYSYLPKQEYKWTSTVYGNVKEEIPKDIPKPLGKSLLHDIVTGKSVMAVLHFVNTTPTDWFSNRQATVETATYGSEFVAAKTATEQIMDLRNTLRYLGVPIMIKAYMFGDNKSVVTSSTIPQSILNKRHNMLSYHRVREAIAAKCNNTCCCCCLLYAIGDDLLLLPTIHQTKGKKQWNEYSKKEDDNDDKLK